MRRFLLVLTMCVLSLVGVLTPTPASAEDASYLATAPQYQYDSGSIKDFCDEKWSERGVLDAHMSQVCQNDEREGFAKWRRLVKDKTYKTFDWIPATFAKIWAKWTERSITQHEMVAFELGEQINAYKTYAWTLKQPKTDQRKLIACCHEWEEHTSRWSMTLYCYKK